MNLPGVDKVTYHKKCPNQENSWEDDPLDGFDKVAPVYGPKSIRQGLRVAI
jgi:hypothetical protein